MDMPRNLGALQVDDALGDVGTVKPAKLFGADILKGGKISFQGEYFGKGDYFDDGSDHAALFGRVELAWNF